ncbi:bacterioferritin [Planctomycetales bacterium]|nr:bacterioferritin [Planctomycetales bacterium]
MATKEQIKAVIEVLNTARSMELQGITQYMNHHYSLGGDDYGKLASEMKKIAKDEMKHAEAFAERIKDIDNTLEPTCKLAADAIKGVKGAAIYDTDAASEDNTITKYSGFAKICRDNNDFVSATLFERIINEEQEHFNYFSDTAEHIKTLGNSFLARQTGE